MDEERRAVIDKKHALAVNYETFFFADLEEKQRFGENIVEYCGLLTDPVEKKRFRPNESSPRYDVGDHPYFFLSESNRAEFVADPGGFTSPRFQMMKPDSAMAG
jgi:YHS domain-containing protein